MAKLPPLNRHTPGVTLFGYIQRPADDFYWHVANQAWEAFVAGHWTSYAIAYTEIGGVGASGDYDADVPAGFTTPGRYRVTVARQAGGSPAVTDVGLAGTDAWDWGGTAENSLAALPAAVWAVTPRTLTASPLLFGSSGSLTVTYTVHDTDGTTPLPGAAVYVSADLAGTQRSEVQLADSLGRTFWQLDPGSVYFWRSAGQRTFTNPDGPKTVS
jgi:hypothetical protein